MADDDPRSADRVEKRSDEQTVGVKKLLETVLREKNSTELVEFLKKYTYDIATTEIPTDQAEIKQLNKEALRAIVQKLNLFSTFNVNAATPAQLESLRERTLECWGSPPREDGAWVEWCLWHHHQRQTGGLPSADNLDVSSLKQQAGAYIEKREQLRKERLVESSQYDDIEDIPTSIRDTIAGVLRPAPEEDPAKLPEGEK